METPYQVKYYDALLDYTTWSVMTISTNPAVILFLNECTDETRHIRAVNHPNYTNTKSLFLAPFFLTSAKPENYPKWTWDATTRLFSKTNTKLMNKNLLERSRFADHKKFVIEKIIININKSRLSSRIIISSQEIVYWAKKTQAKAFKNSDYDDALIGQCPYILQYADYAGISLQEAADDILFKAKLDDDKLEKTELLRIKYFNKVRKATSSEELTAIWEEFKLECRVNAQV